MEDLQQIFGDYCIISDATINKSSEDLLNYRREKGDNCKDSIYVTPSEVLLCPAYNVPEKIVFAIDCDFEMNKMVFRTKSGDTFAPFTLTKKAISFFLTTKYAISDRHEFAICQLLGKAEIKGASVFSTGCDKKLADQLDKMEVKNSNDTCSLTPLFRSLIQWLPYPPPHPTLPPDYVLRLILIYGRSNVIPAVDKEVLQKLTKSPYFFIDIFYIHETPSESNSCQAIFDFLCGLDERNTSYIGEVTKNPTALFNQIAQLLAHPLQRSLQYKTKYKLCRSDN